MRLLHLLLLCLFASAPLIQTASADGTTSPSIKASASTNTAASKAIDDAVRDITLMYACAESVHVRVMKSSVATVSDEDVNIYTEDAVVNDIAGKKFIFTSKDFRSDPICGWYFIPNPSDEQIRAIEDAMSSFQTAAKDIDTVLDLAADSGGIVNQDVKEQESLKIDLSKALKYYRESITKHFHVNPQNDVELRGISFPTTAVPDYQNKYSNSNAWDILSSASSSSRAIRKSAMKDVAAFEKYLIPDNQ